MNRRQIQKRLLASEAYWFGTAREMPKVWETITRHHVDPNMSPGVGRKRSGSRLGVDRYEVQLDVTTGETVVRHVPAE